MIAQIFDILDQEANEDEAGRERDPRLADTLPASHQANGHLVTQGEQYRQTLQQAKKSDLDVRHKWDEWETLIGLLAEGEVSVDALSRRVETDLALPSPPWRGTYQPRADLVAHNLHPLHVSCKAYSKTWTISARRPSALSPKLNVQLTETIFASCSFKRRIDMRRAPQVTSRQRSLRPCSSASFPNIHVSLMKCTLWRTSRRVYWRN